MKREYSVLYQPIEDGWITATVPELPGAVTQGKNLEEARIMSEKPLNCFSRAIEKTPSKMLTAMQFGKI